VPATHQAIAQIHDFIRTGELSPGSRLPSEHELAARFGIGRSSVREAVKALELVHVLDVRHGDGTYVTSLEPPLLLRGVGFATALFRDDAILELAEIRRLFEPVATGLAANRIDAETLDAIRGHIEEMQLARDDHAQLATSEVEFHSAIVRASGNGTLTALLAGLFDPTLHARLWCDHLDPGAIQRTIREHQAIHEALAARDAHRAAAASLLHVVTCEQRLREMLAQQERKP
jgi:GntR family transcriptional repressor for pyruvate dehydrogenase complex